MPSNDDIMTMGQTGWSGAGSTQGLIYMQLKLITLILKQAYAISDEDFTLLQAQAPSLVNAAIPVTPFLSNTTL